MNGVLSGAGRFFASPRGRLIALLVIATLGVAALAWRAGALSSFAYYQEPEEFAQQIDPEGKRWRLGGRVVDGSIVEENGRPVRFEIEGEQGQRMTIAYDGIVPNLFGPYAFVVVEGVAESSSLIRASSVVIKHENEFFADTPPEDSPSRRLLPDNGSTDGAP